LRHPKPAIGSPDSPRNRGRDCTAAPSGMSRRVVETVSALGPTVLGPSEQQKLPKCNAIAGPRDSIDGVC
jgi:hypothetical protein